MDLEEPCTYFDNSAIVGDSITFIMFQWESKSNYLGDMLFLARGGTSLNGIVRRFSNIYYKGTEANLEDAIQQSGVERVCWAPMTSETPVSGFCTSKTGTLCWSGSGRRAPMWK